MCDYKTSAHAQSKTAVLAALFGFGSEKIYRYNKYILFPFYFVGSNKRTQQEVTTMAIVLFV